MAYQFSRHFSIIFVPAHALQGCLNRSKSANPELFV